MRRIVFSKVEAITSCASGANGRSATIVCAHAWSSTTIFLPFKSNRLTVAASTSSGFSDSTMAYQGYALWSWIHATVNVPNTYQELHP